MVHRVRTLTHDLQDCSKLTTVSPQSATRRLRLRVAAKLMLYVGFAGVIYVVLSAIRSGDGQVPEVPSLRVDLSEFNVGEFEILQWENRPVLVYRRSDADIVNLRTSDTRLLDATSLNSVQPERFESNFRSESPDWFVAIALGTGKGCTVELLAATEEAFQGEPWRGGFRESCGEDRYDLAGRVFTNQYAEKNLIIPDYQIEGNALVLGR